MGFFSGTASLGGETRRTCLSSALLRAGGSEVVFLGTMAEASGSGEGSSTMAGAGLGSGERSLVGEEFLPVGLGLSSARAGGASLLFISAKRAFMSARAAVSLGLKPEARRRRRAFGFSSSPEVE